MNKTTNHSTILSSESLSAQSRAVRKKSKKGLSGPKRFIISGLAVLTVVSLSGFASTANAGDFTDRPAGSETQQTGIRDQQMSPENRRESPGQLSGQSARRHRRPRFTKEERRALKKAIEDKDYEAWAAIIKDRPISQKINADNFDKFVEALTLARNGDFEAAKKIFDELGLKRPKNRPGKKHHKKNKEKREAIKKALEAGDYDAWLKAVGEDSPIAKKINSENFDRFLEAYNLFKSGDKEGAAKIFKELGLKRPHRRGDRRGPGRRGGQGTFLSQGSTDRPAGSTHLGPGSGEPGARP